MLGHPDRRVRRIADRFQSIMIHPVSNIQAVDASFLDMISDKLYPQYPIQVDTANIIDQNKTEPADPLNSNELVKKSKFPDWDLEDSVSDDFIKDSSIPDALLDCDVEDASDFDLIDSSTDDQKQNQSADWDIDDFEDGNPKKKCLKNKEHFPSIPKENCCIKDHRITEIVESHSDLELLSEPTREDSTVDLTLRDQSLFQEDCYDVSNTEINYQSQIRSYRFKILSILSILSCLFITATILGSMKFQESISSPNEIYAYIPFLTLFIVLLELIIAFVLIKKSISGDILKLFQGRNLLFKQVYDISQNTVLIEHQQDEQYDNYQDELSEESQPPIQESESDDSHLDYDENLYNDKSRYQLLQESVANDVAEARDRFTESSNRVRRKHEIYTKKIRRHIKEVKTKYNQNVTSINSMIKSAQSDYESVLKSILETTRTTIQKHNEIVNNIERQLQKELLFRIDKKREQQTKQYLLSVEITPSIIPGVGVKLTKDLETLGIKTAYDITEERIDRVEGIGSVKKNALMAWRKEIEESAALSSDGILSESVIQNITNIYHKKQDEEKLKIQEVESTAGVREAEIRDRYARYCSDLNSRKKNIINDYDAQIIRLKRQISEHELFTDESVRKLKEDLRVEYWRIYREYQAGLKSLDQDC